MDQQEIIQWLLDSDVSIQYQTYRDLLGKERNDLRNRILFTIFIHKLKLIRS